MESSLTFHHGLRSTQATGRCHPLPAELTRPGIEISGPVSITNMAINALNPGADGERATGYLDDDEDSAGHRLGDTVMAAINRRDATLGTLSFHNPARNRTYELQPGELPFFMHRERGTHLDEHEFKIDGNPIACHDSRSRPHYGARRQGSGPKRVKVSISIFPKVEIVVEEARFYRQFFDFGREKLEYPEGCRRSGVFS